MALYIPLLMQKGFIMNGQNYVMASRRAYLSTLAAVGLGGCLGNSPDSTTGHMTTTEPGTSSGIAVEATAVQYAYRHIENEDWNAIRTADGQFVFVTVGASGTGPVPSRRELSLNADDEIYSLVEIERRHPLSLDVPGEPYTSDAEDTEPRGWLMFDVPAQLDTVPWLRLERGSATWEFKLNTEKATTPPPAWDWTINIPETVAPDETFDITVSATNVGDGPGTFRGAVNFSHPTHMAKGFDIVLGSGESGEATVSASTNRADPGTELKYGVRTPAGVSDETVTVETESSSTESTN